MRKVISSTMAVNFVIWLMLAYLIKFGSSEIKLEFSSNACNRTCANLDFGGACIGENDDGLGPGLQCPGFVNSKNECVDECDAEEVICQKENRTFTYCGNPSRTTCVTLYTNFIPVEGCFEGCGCSDGYVLNAEDECILPQDCNPNDVECPEHTTFNECGNGVMRNCYYYSNEIKEQTVCIPTCSCPDNLVFNLETQTCVDKLCFDLEESRDCVDKHGGASRYRCEGDICQCVCLPGYKLDLNTNKCEYIKISETPISTDFGGACNGKDLETGRECPGFVNRKNECVYQCEPDEFNCQKANRTFTSCGSTCHTTCANLYTKFMQPCNRMCFVGCVCSEGYVLNAEDECISPQNCNPYEIQCPRHTFLNQCGQGLLRTCDNYREEIEEQSGCIPTCTCPDNLVFDEATQMCVDKKLCYDSDENIECKYQYGDGSQYSCDGDNCDCRCSDSSIFDLDTMLCEFYWDFPLDR